MILAVSKGTVRVEVGVMVRVNPNTNTRLRMQTVGVIGEYCWCVRTWNFEGFFFFSDLDSGGNRLVTDFVVTNSISTVFVTTYIVYTGVS